MADGEVGTRARRLAVAAQAGGGFYRRRAGGEVVSRRNVPETTVACIPNRGGVDVSSNVQRLAIGTGQPPAACG